MEKPFTNREITTAITALTKSIDERFTEVHNGVKAIQTQVTVANGRTKKLEIWRATLVGGMAVITTLILPVLFMTLNKLLASLQAEETPTTSQGVQERLIELSAEAEKLKAVIKSNEEPSPDPL